MLDKTLLFAAVSASLFTGCLGDLLYLQNDPLPETWELPASKFAQCATPEPEQMDPAMYVAAKFKHAPAPGVNIHEEVPVSPKGCVRYFQDIKDGQLVSIGVVRAVGVVEAYSALDGSVAFREHERFLTREEFTPTSNRIEIDANADGFFELVLVGAYDREGLVEQVISIFAPSNGQVAERRVQRRIDANAVRITEEKRIAGELTITHEYVGTPMMNSFEQGQGCTQGEERDVECSPEEKQQIDRALEEALKKGSECMARQGKDNESSLNDRELLRHLLKNRAEKFEVKCFTGGGKHATTNISGGKSPYGGISIRLNAGTLACQTSNFVQMTLFHEILHHPRGSHRNGRERGELLKEGKMTDEEYRLTDQIDACEAFCFEDFKTRCSCAACFQVTTCDGLCKAEKDCRKQDLSGQYVTSEAVGALCSRPHGVLTPPSWHKTMASCRANCGDGTCTSYSRSCNTNCN